MPLRYQIECLETRYRLSSAGPAVDTARRTQGGLTGYEQAFYHGETNIRRLMANLGIERAGRSSPATIAERGVGLRLAKDHPDAVRPAFSGAGLKHLPTRFLLGE